MVRFSFFPSDGKAGPRGIIPDQGFPRTLRGAHPFAAEPTTTSIPLFSHQKAAFFLWGDPTGYFDLLYFSLTPDDEFFLLAFIVIALPRPKVVKIGENCVINHHGLQGQRILQQNRLEHEIAIFWIQGTPSCTPSKLRPQLVSYVCTRTTNIQLSKCHYSTF